MSCRRALDFAFRVWFAHKLLNTPLPSHLPEVQWTKLPLLPSSAGCVHNPLQRDPRIVMATRGRSRILAKQVWPQTSWGITATRNKRKRTSASLGRARTCDLLSWRTEVAEPSSILTAPAKVPSFQGVTLSLSTRTCLKRKSKTMNEKNFPIDQSCRGL